MMALLVKRIVFVDPGGKTIQILFYRKTGELSLALLIHPVPMDVRESRIVDGRERFLQIGGQTERLGVTMRYLLPVKSNRWRKVRLLGGVVLGGEPCSKVSRSSRRRWMVTAPVNGAAVDGRVGISSLLPYGTVLSRKNRNSK
jgi:hypothetical protein